MYKRLLCDFIEKGLAKHKVVVLYGARQVGKSSLLKMMFGKRQDVLWLNGDLPDTLRLFETLTPESIGSALGSRKMLIVDEAQNILNIGSKLKIIKDFLPEVSIVVTGSSSFDLANKVNEPLTGRKLEYLLYPFSFEELVMQNGSFEEVSKLNHRLIYGMYPEIVCSAAHERELLENLSGSYIYKDILLWENLKKSDRISNLLRALAFQTGSQVSYTEIGRLCGLDNKTVEKYIALLEQAFIIFRLPSFARNERNELKFSKKLYFYDNGIRNAVLGNFSGLDMRADAGALWENFVISERIKYNAYRQRYAKYYFWRTKQQQEIDLIEEVDGQLTAFEFKLNPQKAKKRAPKAFTDAYPDAVFRCITPDNFSEFVL